YRKNAIRAGTVKSCNFVTSLARNIFFQKIWHWYPQNCAEYTRFDGTLTITGTTGNIDGEQKVKIYNFS
ncbi:MAG: hypothetical protein ACK559_31535, partial [bacterium]